MSDPNHTPEIVAGITTITGFIDVFITQLLNPILATISLCCAIAWYVIRFIRK